MIKMDGLFRRKGTQREVVQERMNFSGYVNTDKLRQAFPELDIESFIKTGLELVEYVHRNLGLTYAQIARALAKAYSREYRDSIDESVYLLKNRLIGSKTQKRYHYLPVGDVVIPKDLYLLLERKAREEGARQEEEGGEISGFVYEEIIKKFKGEKITDVFIDAERDAYVISYKELGGGRKHYKTVSYSIGRRIVEHLKTKAANFSDVTTSIVDSPQSGKITYAELDLEIRIEFIPTPLGECCSLRFLDIKGYFNTSLVELGYSQELVDVLKTVAKKNQGIVLVGGPTGSGKSTMIKAVLLEMNPQERVIRAVEDPVEVIVRGVTHVQVGPGVSFAGAIRSFMRANPDVLFVGEIRDGETAMAFIEASMTGHLALSTIHANDAVDNVQRLALKILEQQIMGEAELNKVLASNLLVSISTRLVRRKDKEGVIPLVEVFMPDEEERYLLEKGEFLKLKQRQKQKGRDLLSEGKKLADMGIIDLESALKYIIEIS